MIEDFKLEISSNLCIHCKRCTRVCPAQIFVTYKDSKVVNIENEDSCIKCGHCVAVCSVGAISHTLFTPDKVHATEYSEMPTPDQIMMLCKTRRSNRAFDNRSVPNESLQMIIEASHRAPTASNLQQVHFTVVTDRNKLREISQLTIDVFNSILKRTNNPFIKPIIQKIMPELKRYIPVFERLKREYENGNDGILRNAKAVIFIHTPKNSKFGSEDSNLAYQNGSLMAESLGVSQFYAGFVLSAIKQDKKHKIEQILNIDGKIHAVMALGMPSFKYSNYIDRQDTVVTYI